MPSRSFHVVTDGTIFFFFLWLSNIPVCVCVHYIFFNQPSTDEQLR